MLLDQTEQEALNSSDSDMHKQTWLKMGVYSTEIVSTQLCVSKLSSHTDTHAHTPVPAEKPTNPPSTHGTPVFVTIFR